MSIALSILMRAYQSRTSIKTELKDYIWDYVLVYSSVINVFPVLYWSCIFSIRFTGVKLKFTSFNFAFKICQISFFFLFFFFFFFFFFCNTSPCLLSIALWFIFVASKLYHTLWSSISYPKFEPSLPPCLHKVCMRHNFDISIQHNLNPDCPFDLQPPWAPLSNRLVTVVTNGDR